MSPSYPDQSSIAVLRLDNPPVNALSHRERVRLLAELARAEEDATIGAIVLIGNAEFFSAGADIREFGTPAAAAPPNLHTLIKSLEQCAKPTIAALSGTCLGGGFELALGCHYRVATPDARVGLPEVKLGLDSRLRRHAAPAARSGLETAHQHDRLRRAGACRGRSPATALFDRIIEGDLVEGAQGLRARDRGRGGKPAQAGARSPGRLSQLTSRFCSSRATWSRRRPAPSRARSPASTPSRRAPPRRASRRA